MKQAYEKAKAHVVLFDNSDVITTSGFSEDINSDMPCKTNGWDKGNHCSNGRSSDCPGKAWKEK